MASPRLVHWFRVHGHWITATADASESALDALARTYLGDNCITAIIVSKPDDTTPGSWQNMIAHHAVYQYTTAEGSPFVRLGTVGDRTGKPVAALVACPRCGHAATYGAPLLADGDWTTRDALCPACGCTFATDIPR